MIWLKENDCPWDEYTFISSAVKLGSLNTINLMDEKGCSWGFWGAMTIFLKSILSCGRQQRIG